MQRQPTSVGTNGELVLNVADCIKSSYAKLLTPVMIVSVMVPSSSVAEEFSRFLLTTAIEVMPLAIRIEPEP